MRIEEVGEEPGTRWPSDEPADEGYEVEWASSDWEVWDLESIDE